MTALPALGQDQVMPAPWPSFRPAPVPAEISPQEPVEPVASPELAAPLAAFPDPAQTQAPASLRNALTATDAARAVATTLQDVKLSAMITDGGTRINDGLIWRVFETRTNQQGELQLAGSSYDPEGTFKLAPGNYVVHVAYGRAQASEPLEVGGENTEKAIILDAGAMRLNAAISGDVPIPINLLRFDIFNENDETARGIVAQNLSPNDVVTLNAGTYHVVSHFGDVNAVVRADLRVEPGQLTDATLYHQAAQVSFKLVTQAGGEAIADIDWTIKTEEGETIFSAIGAFPTTVLAEGDYLVLAKRGEQVFNRQFQVQPGQAREVEVLTTVY
ncbi:MAG: SPOR domain-containing protein [Devosia sp.]